MAKKNQPDDTGSLVNASHGTWAIAPSTNFRNTTLTYLLFQELAKPDPKSPDPENPRTIAEGFIADLVTQARSGNSTAIAQLLDRTEGKVPQTSVSATINLDDDERAARIIQLLRRGGDQAGTVRSDPDGEGGA